MKLEYVEGIGTKYANKLRQAGVKSTDALLKMGATKKGRQEIAKASGVSEKLVLTWVNHVDLFRINGIGQEFAELLEQAGVDSVPELAQRRPDNLAEAISKTNSKNSRKLVRRKPGMDQIKDWIGQAKKLKKIVSH